MVLAFIEKRKRKDGSVTHYVRWIDPETKTRMTQKMDSEESAKFLLTVLLAHGSNVGAALDSATDTVAPGWRAGRTRGRKRTGLAR